MDRFVGYFALDEDFALARFPGARLEARSKRGVDEDGTLIFPLRYDPGGAPLQQIEFALKYEGVDLGLLRKIFSDLGQEEVASYIAEKPTGIHRRRIWFLYEWLLGVQLDQPDVKTGQYISILDPEKELVGSAVRVRRQRVFDNLLGNPRFCPLVKRVKRVEWKTKELKQRAQELAEAYDPGLLRRAMHYLFTKETRASFAIEREEPGRIKTERFVQLLHTLEERRPMMTKQRLVDLQTEILDPRYAETEYRHEQNYVGEELGDYRIRVHYVPPKPEDVEDLMQGWLECTRRLCESECPAPIVAAALSFGFVFIHPFLDGNGRLHRLLIHDILARMGFAPKGIVFPISAAILRREQEYDRILETVSEPLLRMVDYELGARGDLKVNGETADLYRYLDYTRFAEYLYSCIERTLERDFPEELATLQRYDRTRAALRKVVDMPDRKLDLLIRFLWQNGGKLSAKKRAKFFPELTDEEVAAMEKIRLETKGRTREG